MKFLPHYLKQVNYKILGLDSKFYFVLFPLMNVVEMAVLCGFCEKNDLGSLGVKEVFGIKLKYYGLVSKDVLEILGGPSSHSCL